MTCCFSRLVMFSSNQRVPHLGISFKATVTESLTQRAFQKPSGLVLPSQAGLVTPLSAPRPLSLILKGFLCNDSNGKSSLSLIRPLSQVRPEHFLQAGETGSVLALSDTCKASPWMEPSSQKSNSLMLRVL